MPEDYLRRHLREVPPHRALLRSVECKLFAEIELRHPVLDLGCGDGHFASVAFQEPIEAGLDTSWQGVAEAARRGVYKQLALASGCTLPFAEEAFATVISNCVIEHIPDINAVLQEVSRVLVEGGVFAFTVPSEHFGDFLFGTALCRRLKLHPLARLYSRWFNRISFHYHCYPPHIWEAKLAAVGLVVLRHQYYFSQRAHHVFDISHYLGAPTILTKKLFDQWVLFPRLIDFLPLERWLRRYYEGEENRPVGAYLFFLCEKER